MNVLELDAFEFCRLNDRREGQAAIADMHRLAEELTKKSGSLVWSLQGGADKFGHSQLTLSVSGTVHLRCQRCLTEFAFEIKSESILILAKDEAGADEIDALLSDDTIDVIVGSKALNIIELIEDEALLALPLSPKHVICPDAVALDALMKAKEDSPFASLKNLKQNQ